MSLPAMTFGDRFYFSRKGGTGGGGWVQLEGADNKAVSRLCFRNALVGSGWATAILLCTNGLRKQSSCPTWHPFSCGEAFIPVWASVGTFTRLVLRLSTLYQCCTGIWYEVEAKPSHYLILLVTCSESMQGEGCVCGLIKQILQ